MKTGSILLEYSLFSKPFYRRTLFFIPIVIQKFELKLIVIRQKVPGLPFLRILAGPCPLGRPRLGTVCPPCPLGAHGTLSLGAAGGAAPLDGS